MFSDYFDNYAVRAEFRKEFVSLWSSWLGQENLHKLDQVTEAEWERFNNLLVLIQERYEVLIADLEKETLHKVLHPNELIQNYCNAKTKNNAAFRKLVIPELNCALTEEWDFTYILWHKDESAVAALSPLISQVELHHFSENT